MGNKKHEHHGGAWKVAYADFVTAMMALFMVLWISAQDQEILLATSRYFQNPFNSPLEASSGIMVGNASGSGNDDNGDKPPSNVVDMAFLHKLANEMFRLLNIQSDTDDHKPIDIAVTGDGLRIKIFDRKNQPVFKPGTTEFTPWGGLVVQNLAWQLDQYQMAVRIDSYAGTHIAGEAADYDPWELSSERGNAMRRGLVYYALDPEKIDRVTAFVVESPIPGQGLDDEESQRLELSLMVPQR